MARARNIKPGFFSNDLLAECEPLARLLFAGLWTIADREGRLEDRPKKIGANVLPYDACDTNALLDQLAAKGFIVRYVVGGRGFIQITTWSKHQNPHQKEAASEIPAPDTENPIQAPDLSSAQQIQEEDERKEVTERAGLNPSSLNPDSPISDSLREPLVLVGSASDPTPPRIPCPTEKLIEAFHQHCPTLPRVMKLTPDRRKKLSSRWREVDADSKFTDADDGVQIFGEIFKRVHQSDFLSGRAGKWTASFDWLVENEKHILKVCEGNYDNGRYGT